MSHGKRIRKARESIERTKLYKLEDALKLVKGGANAKFDETVDVAIRLGVDPRHADQIVRGTVVLPAGTGKTETTKDLAAMMAVCIYESIARPRWITNLLATFGRALVPLERGAASTSLIGLSLKCFPCVPHSTNVSWIRWLAGAQPSCLRGRNCR